MPRFLNRQYLMAFSILLGSLAVVWLALIWVLDSGDELALDQSQPAEERIEALKKLTGTRARKAWRICLDDPSSKSRQGFLIASGELKASEAVEPLDQIAGDEKQELVMRLLAAESLARICGSGDYPGLLKALECRQGQLRLAAAEALVRCGQEEQGYQALFTHARSLKYRRWASLRLQRITGQSFPIDEKAGPVKAHQQVLVWERWWAQEKAKGS